MKKTNEIKKNTFTLLPSTFKVSNSPNDVIFLSFTGLLPVPFITILQAESTNNTI